MNLKVKLLVSATVLLAAVGVFGSLTTGTVHGTEWSPDAVAHRSYEYQVVFGVPVGSRTTKEFKTSLEQELHYRGYVPNGVGDTRWFIVDQTGPLGRSVSNRDLYVWDDEATTPAWIAWSQQSPELAAQFWGLIIGKARQAQNSEVHRVLVDEASDVRHQTQLTGIQNIVNPVCRVRS